MTDRAAALTFLTGDVFTGREAWRWAWSPRPSSRTSSTPRSTRSARRWRKGTPQGLRETKLLLGRHLVARIDEHGADLAKLSARLFGSDEARAAMQAFLDRRK